MIGAVMISRIYFHYRKEPAMDPDQLYNAFKTMLQQFKVSTLVEINTNFEHKIVIHCSTLITHLTFNGFGYNMVM